MKPHKFFEGFPQIDLDSLAEEMMVLRDRILAGEIDGIPEEKIKSAWEEKDLVQSSITPMGSDYNILLLGYDSLVPLKETLADVLLEACDYYEIDAKKEDYVIMSWLNVTYGRKINALQPPPVQHISTDNYHDHNDGRGAPDFHGYFCVKAEPSTTNYLINRDTPFENINIDGRAVVSETGHPHNVDPWNFDTPRITIAYDICPRENMNHKNALSIW